MSSVHQLFVFCFFCWVMLTLPMQTFLNVSKKTNKTHLPPKQEIRGFWNDLTKSTLQTGLFSLFPSLLVLLPPPHLGPSSPGDHPGV